MAVKTHVWTRTLNVDGTTYTRTDTITNEGAIELTPAFGVVTDQLLEIQFRVAALKSVHIEVDANATIKTNSSGSPAQTFNMVPGDPLDWHALEQAANPFTTDVTAFYVTCASACNMVIQILKDATP